MLEKNKGGCNQRINDADQSREFSSLTPRPSLPLFFTSCVQRSLARCCSTHPCLMHGSRLVNREAWPAFVFTFSQPALPTTFKTKTWRVKWNHPLNLDTSLIFSFPPQSRLCSGLWSRGMMLALGARGHEFDSRKSPFLFEPIFSTKYFAMPPKIIFKILALSSTSTNSELLLNRKLVQISLRGPPYIFFVLQTQKKLGPLLQIWSKKQLQTLKII